VHRAQAPPRREAAGPLRRAGRQRRRLPVRGGRGVLSGQMRPVWQSLLLVAIGCGRLGYDPLAVSDAAAADAAGPDATPPLGPFGPRESIDELNHIDGADDCALTGDMLEIFFNSDRPGGAGGGDL